MLCGFEIRFWVDNCLWSLEDSERSAKISKSSTLGNVLAIAFKLEKFHEELLE
jgi:hypothetical protein